MDTNKNRVVNYFASDRDFASGKQLYGQLSNKSIAFLNSLNRMTDTPANCARLHYELGKLGGFNDRGIKILLQKPLVTVKEKENVIVEDGQMVDPFVIPVFEKGLPGVTARKTFAKANNIEVTGKKNKNFDAAFATWRETKINEAIRESKAAGFKAMPDKVKQAVKLRDQFPFLSQDDCPDVFKILTADLISAYWKYVKAHEKLFTDYPLDALHEAVADVVDPYKENKLIWAELDHYQTNGKPLGKHPIFAKLAREEELRNKNGEDLAKIQANLKSNISKTKKAIKDADEKKAIALKAKLNSFQIELNLTKLLLKGKK